MFTPSHFTRGGVAAFRYGNRATRRSRASLSEKYGYANSIPTAIVREEAMINRTMRSDVPRILPMRLLTILGTAIGLASCATRVGNEDAGNELKVQKATQALTNRVLLHRGSIWKYQASGVDLGTDWIQPGWDDTGWNTGKGELGFGDGDEATKIASPVGNAKLATVYFRTSFDIADTSQFAGVRLSFVRDDAAIIYLNGVEIFRDNNLPSSGVTYATRASRDVSAPEESLAVQVDVPTSVSAKKCRVDRAVDGGSFEHVGTVWAERFTSYVDPSLEPNRAYTYRVRAVRDSGEMGSN